MKLYLIYILCLTTILCGCQSEAFPDPIFHGMDMQRTLAYYKYIERDSLKYEAAKFLVDNMPYHYSNVRLSKNSDSLELWRKDTDSLYYSLVSKVRTGIIDSDSLARMIAIHRNASEKDTLSDAVVDYRWLSDTEEIDYNFLRNHIDNAFSVWRTSPYAKDLTFDEFKEYILPYRSVCNYGFNETGKTYRDLFGKYLSYDSKTDLRSIIEQYNTAINNLRDMNGKTHRQQMAGLYDMYSRDFHGCVDIANYGCNILRACGAPVVVEHNVCYRSLPGQHYHCSVYDKKRESWQTFNAESSLPGDGDWAFAETANVYRTTFGAQKDTPYFLKAEGEYVPYVLNDPCMKDVTSYLTQTTSITLGVKENISGNLAYLTTFRKSDRGVIPVTWGVIDKQKGSVTFKNAQPNILYFPVYYHGEDLRYFGSPFVVELENGLPEIKNIPYTENKKGENLESVVLTRKYPRKPNMLRVAKELVGGKFIASNKTDFSKAKILLEITETPEPHLITYKLEHAGRYRYYRFQASDEHPYANISMLEWLTPFSYGYANTMEPYRSHIVSPSDTIVSNKESHLVRLMDEDTWDKMSWKSEYDGNMQTAPSPYPNITLLLKEPQVVTHVRFSPKNADNGICAGDVYELYYWDSGWKSLGQTTADYEYVMFEQVPKGKLYWLENKSQGEEEMPFVIDQNGHQQFIYYDLFDPMR